MARPAPALFVVLAIAVSLLRLGSRLIRKKPTYDESTPEDVIDD